MIRHCVYCGWPCGANATTCRAHRDLPSLDPHSPRFTYPASFYPERKR